jgi:hypothetical protein
MSRSSSPRPIWIYAWGGRPQLLSEFKGKGKGKGKVKAMPTDGWFCREGDQRWRPLWQLKAAIAEQAAGEPGGREDQ